jgi:hypothetical protein
MAKTRIVTIPCCPGCGDEHSIIDTLGRPLNLRALAAWGHPAVRVIKTDTGRSPTYLQRIHT